MIDSVLFGFLCLFVFWLTCPSILSYFKLLVIFKTQCLCKDDKDSIIRAEIQFILLTLVSPDPKIAPDLPDTC